MCCFPKSRINVNGGNKQITSTLIKVLTKSFSRTAWNGPTLPQVVFNLSIKWNPRGFFHHTVVKLIIAKFGTVSPQGDFKKSYWNLCEMHHSTSVLFYSRRIPPLTVGCYLLKMKALLVLFRKTILVKRVIPIHLVPLTISHHRLSRHWSTPQYAGSRL